MITVELITLKLETLEVVAACMYLKHAVRRQEDDFLRICKDVGMDRDCGLLASQLC